MSQDLTTLGVSVTIRDMKTTTQEATMVVIPTEHVALYASHGFTFVSEWYGGTVLMEKPQ